MNTAPFEELYRLEKRIYRKNKRLIEDSILVKEPDFERYEAEYRRRVGKYVSISSDEEMMDAVAKSNIIFVGDYHTCRQSQRSFLRILKLAVKKTRDISIALELVHASRQKVLDDFMAGKIREDEFIKRIGLRQRWIFDLWENFKPIFDFARYHRIPLFAIDAAEEGSSLRKRDKAAGSVIAKLFLKDPSRKIFVLIGDLHIAPEHLPRETEEALHKLSGEKNPMPKMLILYQNSEDIYWELAKKGMADSVSVVKIDEMSYCRMHTPPLVVQQSYINWLEHEEGEIDYADAKASFLELVNTLSRFLGIRLKKGEKENVEVYTSGDLSFLNRLKCDKNFSSAEFERLKRQILASESYYIPSHRIVYLANLSINHAAEEAAHFIKYVCSGAEPERAPVDAFYANILHEALGFFGSKLINNKRKCMHEKEFAELLNYFHSIKVPEGRRLEYETAYIVGELLKSGKEGLNINYSELYRKRPLLFMSVTHAIGYMLGDRLYYAFKEGVISPISVKYLFYDRWESPGTPYKVYTSLCDKTAHVKIPKRM